MTTEPDDIAAEAQVIEEMRYVWQQGRKTSDSAAADLHGVAQKLAELRRLRLPGIPSSDPGEWFEPFRVPGFPFAPDTVDQMFGTLIGHIQLMAYRYEHEARDLEHSLAELDKPGPFVAPAELRGCMVGVYTPKQVTAVFGQISDLSGLRIVCVWEYFDAYGYGGNSAFYVESENGQALHYLAGDLWAWLSTRGSDPETPGDPTSWVGAVATELTATDLGGDDFHNYATEYLQ